MQRICPRDGTRLVEEHIETLNIDVCPACSGVFLDGIELKRALGDKGLALKLGAEHGGVEDPIACPACSERMHLDKIDGISLDHCAHCLGVWLDAGELDRIASRDPRHKGALQEAKLAEILRTLAARARR